MHLVPAVLVLPIIRLSGRPIKTLLPPAAFGQAALAPAVVLFVVMNILQFTAGVWFLDRDIRWLMVVAQPIVIAALLGIAYQLAGLRIDDSWLMPVAMLGQVAVPLMLFTLGTSLAGACFSAWRLGLWYGGIVVPAAGIIAAFLLLLILPLSDLQQRMLILYGALPPAVLTFIFAQRYNQEPGQVAAIVLIGNMLSVLVIPVVLFFVLSA